MFLPFLFICGRLFRYKHVDFCGNAASELNLCIISAEGLDFAFKRNFSSVNLKSELFLYLLGNIRSRYRTEKLSVLSCRR